MLVIIDWLTFTLSAKDYYSLMMQIGLGDIAEKFAVQPGYWRYDTSHYYDGISILSKQDKNNFCVNMSGQGCRTFEDIAKIDWLVFFSMIMDTDQLNGKITRIDIAADDNKLNIKTIMNRTQEFADGNKTKIRTIFQYAEAKHTTAGITCYYGSPDSNIRIRIYDKGAELGRAHNELTRCEVQIRKDNAHNFVKQLTERQDIGVLYSGVVNYHLQFLSGKYAKKQDDIVSRWWTRFLERAEKIKLYKMVGREYNLTTLHRYVDVVPASSIRTLIECTSEQEVLDIIYRDRDLSHKQKALIDVCRQKKQKERIIEI